jgi:hypothetical protein
MGTNFNRIPKEEEVIKRKAQLLKDLDTLSLDPANIERCFQETNDDNYNSESCWDKFVDGISVHLGKRSMGWKFCWNFHKNKYYSNKEELLAYIRSGRVVDEYGAEIEVEEFIEMALTWCQPDGLTVNHEYEKRESEKNPNRFWHGPKYWDLEIDGLRVSSATDFS